MPRSVATAEIPVTPVDDPSGVTVSLMFWITLLAAAGMFAVVSLSPKLSVSLALDQQFQAQQRELIDLEQEHQELERVIAALKDDPNFAAELARLEFDAVRPGEEILSVDSDLRLEPHAAAKPHQSPAVINSPWQPWIEVLAYNQPLRTALLVTSALLILWAFGWLQDRSDSPA